MGTQCVHLIRVNVLKTYAEVMGHAGIIQEGPSAYVPKDSLGSIVIDVQTRI